MSADSRLNVHWHVGRFSIKYSIYGLSLAIRLENFSSSVVVLMTQAAFINIVEHVELGACGFRYFAEFHYTIIPRVAFHSATDELPKTTADRRPPFAGILLVPYLRPLEYNAAQSFH